jgi:ferrous iron transport protein B
MEKIEHAKRSDGTPIFNAPTSASLLVFFVLAMQCLPTIAVTRRETGSWNWALLQLGYMTVLAWVCAFITFQFVSGIIS